MDNFIFLLKPLSVKRSVFQLTTREQVSFMIFNVFIFQSFYLSIFSILLNRGNTVRKQTMLCRHNIAKHIQIRKGFIEQGKYP